MLLLPFVECGSFSYSIFSCFAVSRYSDCRSSKSVLRTGPDGSRFSPEADQRSEWCHPFPPHSIQYAKNKVLAFNSPHKPNGVDRHAARAVLERKHATVVLEIAAPHKHQSGRRINMERIALIKYWLLEWREKVKKEHEQKRKDNRSNSSGRSSCKKQDGH